MAKALGFGDMEIFPKQTELLAERGDVGNFLNLPYHGGIRGMRYALDDNGEAITETDFYEYYKKVVLTETQIEEIKVKSSNPLAN